jgi:PAS domain S-box-containing protein
MEQGTSMTNRDFNEISVPDHISAMLAYWDKDLICRFANAAYLEWFGKTPEEMIDKMTLDELLGPDLYEQNRPHVLAALQGKAQTFEREIKLPDGGIRYGMANYSPDIVHGRVLGFYVHVADVSHMKLLEKELMYSHEIASRQNNRLLNFANIVSHNLNTHVVNLETLVEFLTQAENEAERAELMTFLKKLSEGFRSTINNLTEIADAQNLDSLKYEWVNLYEYVEEAMAMLHNQVEESNALIVNRVDSGYWIWASPGYVDSIILNFLTNAIKYRHPDHIPLIELDADIRGNELAFRIRDNGIGIDLQKHGKDIFGLYKTFHGNSDAKGVGLYIAKFQTEAMGGRIEVESEINKGTTFTVYFTLNLAELP